MLVRTFPKLHLGSLWRYLVCGIGLIVRKLHCVRYALPLSRRKACTWTALVYTKPRYIIHASWYICDSNLFKQCDLQIYTCEGVSKHRRSGSQAPRAPFVIIYRWKRSIHELCAAGGLMLFMQTFKNKTLILHIKHTYNRMCIYVYKLPCWHKNIVQWIRISNKNTILIICHLTSNAKTEGSRGAN